MEPVSITCRSGRIWWITGCAWALATAIGAFWMLVGRLFFGDRLDTWDWSTLIGLPAGIALALLLYFWLTRGKRARRLTADSCGVMIERLDGQLVTLRWEEIRGLDFNSLDDEMFALRTHDSRHAVLGYEFAPHDWSRWLTCVAEYVGEEIEVLDTQVNFDDTVSSWLDWSSIAFAVVGGGATLGLIVFLPSNAAGWIILAGTAAVLIYLERVCGEYAGNHIPVAKYIGFYAAKVLAIIPLALVALIWVRPAGFPIPAHKHAALYYLSNTMFFGGMAVALLVRGGYSPAQYYSGDLRGVNRYQKPAFVAALVICAVGVALKAWNEG